MIGYFNFPAPSAPQNIALSSINATAVNVSWEEPLISNGIIRSYAIAILTITSNPVTNLSHSGISILSTTIYGLTHNTDYILYIRAVTVEPGDAALISFTTPSCKCVIVLMCYVMYCFY